eukprot:IDg102t1
MLRHNRVYPRPLGAREASSLLSSPYADSSLIRCSSCSRSARRTRVSNNAACGACGSTTRRETLGSVCCRRRASESDGSRRSPAAATTVVGARTSERRQSSVKPYSKSASRLTRCSTSESGASAMLNDAPPPSASTIDGCRCARSARRGENARGHAI